jgi:hypothetical protein
MLVREAMTPAPTTHDNGGNGHAPADDIGQHMSAPIVIIPASDSGAPHAFPGEPVRAVLHRMLDTGVTVVDVVDPETRQRLGQLSLTSILEARQRIFDDERTRERMYSWRALIRRPRRASALTGSAAE